MVDITSLKARLAKLRLGSEFEDKHPELRDPASDDLDKKRGKKKQKKAAQDPYNEYTKNTNKRKKNNKLTRSDQKRGKKLTDFDKQPRLLDPALGEDVAGNVVFPDKEGNFPSTAGYTRNTGGKRKKKNKLTRSDQKRP